jgi:hypothetical protein
MGMDLSYSYYTHFEIGICVSMGVVQSIENGDLLLEEEEEEEEEVPLTLNLLEIQKVIGTTWLPKTLQKVRLCLLRKLEALLQ